MFFILKILNHPNTVLLKMNSSQTRGLGFLTQIPSSQTRPKIKKERTKIKRGKTFEFIQEHLEKPKKHRFKTIINHVI